MKIHLHTSLTAACALLLAGSFPCSAQTITTVAGCGIGNDSVATYAEVIAPMMQVGDNAGNVYIADQGNNIIRKVNSSGIISTYAGTGYYGATGDGGPATAATFEDLYSLTFDKNGNLYIIDAGANKIRVINSDGIISTFAGTGTMGYSGDGGPAAAATLNYPSDLVADTSGNVFIVDRFNYVVRKVNASGIISTIAGTSSPAAPVFDGPATASPLGYPFRIAINRNQELIVSAYGYWHIMKIDGAGMLTNLAGDGAYGFSGDGGPATAAEFSAPCGLTTDTAGNVYFSDIDHDRIRKIDVSTGLISTVIGNGSNGFSGDGDPATAAMINGPQGLFVDSANTFYFCDNSNNVVRTVSAAGIISTVAGRNGLFGEGYPGINSEFTNLENIGSDPAGNIYIPDPYNQRVRMLSATTGKITTVAGSGLSSWDYGFSGDGGPATAARLLFPVAVAADHSGNLFICDQDNQRIRKVDASGNISTIAGDGTMGFTGDGTSALTAEFKYPTGIAVDATGNIFIADNNNHRIRKINTAGIITTIAGTGDIGYSEDGVVATRSKLNYPADVAVDAVGNVYISDQLNSRVRMVDTAGIIHTFAGTGIAGDSGDGGPATAAEISDPQGLKIDGNGNLFIADAASGKVRMVSPAGTITTVAGNGTTGFGGDGGPATAAAFAGPAGLAFDASGSLFISDNGNQRIRKVTFAPEGVTQIQGPQNLVSVFPNPTTGLVNIDNNAGGNVIVTDIAGKQIMSSQTPGTKAVTDLSGLPEGTYILQVIRSTGKMQTIKVTKQ